jgi:hypothetical protein
LTMGRSIYFVSWPLRYQGDVIKYGNSTPSPEIYWTNQSKVDNFSLQVVSRLCGLEEDCFPLSYTGVVRPTLSTLHSPHKRVSLAGLP